MLGRDHALLGALAYVALAPIVDHAEHVPVVPVQVGIGSLVFAGFALLPDIDEPGSTVSRKLGFVSRLVSEFTNKLAGGHRQATHSLLFCALVYFGAHYALRSEWAVGTIVCCALLLSIRLVLPFGLGRSWWVMLAITVGATVWVVHDHDVGSWLPIACAAGTFAHLVGDGLTVEGVPLFWVPFVRPLQKIRLALPILGHTDSIREQLMATAMAALILFFGYVNIYRPIEIQEQHAAPTQVSHVTGHAPNVSSLTNKATGALDTARQKVNGLVKGLP